MNTLDIIMATVVISLLGIIGGVTVVLLFAKFVTSFL